MTTTPVEQETVKPKRLPVLQTLASILMIVAILALSVVTLYYSSLILPVVWGIIAWLFQSLNWLLGILWFNSLGMPCWWLSKETGASPFSPGFLTTCLLLGLVWQIKQPELLDSDPSLATKLMEILFSRVKFLALVYVVLFVCGLWIRLA